MGVGLGLGLGFLLVWLALKTYRASLAVHPIAPPAALVHVAVRPPHPARPLALAAQPAAHVLVTRRGAAPPLAVPPVGLPLTLMLLTWSGLGSGLEAGVG